MNNEVFNQLLDSVFSLPFSQKEKIKEIEIKIYQELKLHPGDPCGLIILMFVQMIQGKKEDAKELANQIWTIGGEMPMDFELLFIENLLNLGLLNMAYGLLKPKFENLRKYIDDFYSVLTKFSVMVGSTALIKRLKPFADEDDNILFEFAELFEQAICSSQFKDIQKMVIDKTITTLCTYEYDLYDDEGYPELVVILYLNQNDEYCKQLENDLNKRIAAYWLSCQKKQLYNLNFEIKNISNHNSWFEEDE